MKSPSSCHQEHSATEPKTTTTAAAAASEKENTKVDFERQAHHSPAANVPQKQAAASTKKAVPKKRAAKKRAAKATAKAAPKAAPKKKHRKSNTQADLLNIGTDHLSIIRLSLFNKMIPGELQNFCLQVVGLCDTFTMNDRNLMFAVKPVLFSND